MDETEVTQDKTEETPQEQTTDNQAEVERLTAELAKRDKENLNLQQTVTRHANRENDLRKQNQQFLDQMQSFEETQAVMMDRLDELSGSETETTRKSSHVDELHKKRDEAQKSQQQPQSPFDEDVIKLANYIDEQGLQKNSAIVASAISGTKTAGEALENLKKAVGEEADNKLGKKAAEIAEQIVQQRLKEMGVAKADGSPTGSNQDDETFMREFSEGKSDDYQRMDKLLKKMK